MAEKDCWGQEVPSDEPDDEVIEVWEITPHLQRPREYTSMVSRSWQNMIGVVTGSLEEFLEGFEVDDLREGVSIKFRLIDIRKDDYEECAEVGL